MRNRAALVVLYEDEFHETFLHAFVKRIDKDLAKHIRYEPQEGKSGVFDAFPQQMRLLRRSHVRTRLVVLIDADERSAAQIEGLLRHKLREAAMPDDFSREPVLVIRPRWELENWALHLLGESIGEDRDRNSRAKVGSRGRDAARLLAKACKAGQLPQPTLPSLEEACREWQAYRERRGL